MKHMILLTVIVSALATLSPCSAEEAGTALGKVAREMKPGEWRKFDSKGFDKALLYSSGKTILPYSNKAAWDPKTGTVHFIGMCHMTPPMKHIRYSAKANSWSALPPEDWYKSNKWFHAYDNSTAGNGVFYHNFWGSQVWQYDIEEQKWTKLPKVLRKGSHGASLTFFPDMGKEGALIHLFGRNGIQAYDIEKKSWRYIKGDLSKLGPYHNVSMYNPKRHTVILGGGNGCKLLYELNAKGELSALKEAPITIGVNSSKFVIDPASGDLLVYSSRKGNGGFYGLSLSEKDADWKKLPDARASSGVVVSLRGLGVTMWFGHQGCWLYKHKPAR
jgi:hypothetical protein